MIGTACFFNQFLDKKEQNLRFQTNYQEKTLIIERQFFQNVTVFYDRYILFFRFFFVKKRAKRETSDRFLGNAPLTEWYFL